MSRTQTDSSSMLRILQPLHTLAIGPGTIRVSGAAVCLGSTRTSIPTVNADLSRFVTFVPVVAAISVSSARLLVADPFRQTLPWKTSEKDEGTL